ncbi:hypothetical protein ES332_A10G180300v1 [Gossypium tomentosum]|uniref:Uncharacterized protein n=1 Tax=Gossypium tomentosum TaxID=34277 RepID=A0A5D2NSK8_GOSTO|nr:hypothetical protein ES332_A10G180300v1 [Gossypium tomentosum]
MAFALAVAGSKRFLFGLRLVQQVGVIWDFEVLFAAICLCLDSVLRMGHFVPTDCFVFVALIVVAL